MMITSTLLGIITMLLYKPKSWCVYCPMGTMTQLISKSKYKKNINANCLTNKGYEISIIAFISFI